MITVSLVKDEIISSKEVIHEIDMAELPESS